MNKGLALATPGPIAHLMNKSQERRRHQRVKVTLLGRYMLEDRREFPCQTVDMSPGGVALFAPVKAAIGDRVIVYLDEIGRIEGRIARHLDTGFALALKVSPMKRDKLADKLTWLTNRHSLGMPEDRRHERIVPRHLRSTLKLADGREYLVKIVDVSLSGVALGVDVDLPLGAVVTVGQTQGRVVRHMEGGLAIEFLRLIPADQFDENVRL